MRWLILMAAIFLAPSVVSFAAYGLDKRAAIRGRRRIRERSLHLIDLIGGWPGGLAAQRVFRHKTRDVRFLCVFWLTAVTHSAVIAGAFWLLA
ncbi:MAG: DUF1294 domain-containing protein [Planctomycetota bacterium]